MKYLIFTTIFFVFSFASFAQTPEEGLRTAWYIQNGTARSNAIAGATGSLGGDITVNHVNPAGLGLYRTKEFVLSVGTNENNNDFLYRGTNNGTTKGIFRYGTMGIILGKQSDYHKNKSSAFSFSINQLASFNNRISYSGFNNYSSFSEQYLEELVNDKADTNAALSNYIFGSTLAFRTYLVDATKDSLGKFNGYKSLVPISTGVNQNYNAYTQGGLHEIAIGFGANELNKWYFGGSLNIPLISYKRTLEYSETDATKDTTNNFGYFTYNESLSSFGAGVGLKIGAIYKLNERMRVGLAFHTPQFISMKDRISASMTTNTEGFKRTLSETSTALNSGNEGTREYTIQTPYRIIGSFSYVFNQVEDTRKQRGFVSLDVEFVNYRGSRFSKSDEEGNTIKGYYNVLNEAIQKTYKGNVNLKLGGEIKFDPIAFRAGAAYYGSPYADKNLDASRFLLSGGVGYRNKGIFIDASYSYTFVKDVQFPYRLNDIANTFATQGGNNKFFMLTVGFKF